MADRIIQQLSSFQPNWKSLVGTAESVGITAIKGRGEPQRSYMWEVYVKGQTAMPSNTYTYAKTVSIPNFSTEDMVLNYMGEQLHYAGKNSSNKSIQVTFWVNQKLTPYKELLDWWYKTSEPTTGFQTYKNHKGTGYAQTLELKLIDVTNFRYNAVITMENAYPTEIGEVSLSYESSEMMEVSATFVFDTINMGKYTETVSSDILSSLGLSSSLFKPSLGAVKSLL